MEKIVIRPIKRNNFSGISAYTKSIESFSTQLNKDTGLYKTGLTEKEAEEFEKKLSLPINTLAPYSDYWGSEIIIRLHKDKDTTLYVSSPREELIKRVLLQRSNIAKPGEKITPTHTFQIYNPDEEAKKENITIDFELEAADKFKDLTVAEKRDVLRLLGSRGVDTVSEEVIRNTLWKFIKLDPSKFLNTLKDPAFETKAMIYRLIDKGIINKTSNNQYMFGEDHIGSTITDVIAFLNDPKNQKVKLSLKAKSKE